MRTKTPHPNQRGLFTRQDYIDQCRVEARKLLQTRSWITSEDVTTNCHRPDYLHHNVVGAIFQHPDFQMVGVMPATRQAARGHLIRKWALKYEPESPDFGYKQPKGREYDTGD